MFSGYVESGPPLLNPALGKIRATFKLNANVTLANVIRRTIISSTPLLRSGPSRQKPLK